MEPLLHARVGEQFSHNIERKRRSPLANMIIKAAIIGFLKVASLAAFVDHKTPGQKTAVYSDSYKRKYCDPSSSCWPNSDAWRELGSQISGTVTAFEAGNYGECLLNGDDARGIEKTGQGICMQYHDCKYEYCNSTRAIWDLSEYSVEVKTAEDIIKAVQFANTHNIPITVKTTGHNYAGSSSGRGTLQIWMINYGEGVTKKLDGSYKDTCGTKVDHVVKVGGGQIWEAVYRAVGKTHHIVGGGGLTVSAAGGWLQGGGLSSTSRLYGLGVDNVLDYEVILADGRKVIADACSEPDLFWALRGGGGGTFGVVTAVHYKVRPVEKMQLFRFSLDGKDVLTNPWVMATYGAWYTKFVELTVNLDNRWGGYWTDSQLIFYFVGSKADADTTFVTPLRNWVGTLNAEQQKLINIKTKEYDSYYMQRNLDGSKPDTDPTGSETFNIANRLISREWVKNNKAKMVEIIGKTSQLGFHFNYFLGGVIENVKGDATPVNPAYRKAVYQMIVFDEANKQADLLRKEFPNGADFGSGLNHADKVEPDWENAFWGSNLARLNSLKTKYDPKNRFNCWHCIGWTGPSEN